MNTPFSCDRTCPAHGQFWCRFRPVLDSIGQVRVNSETARIKVEYNDPKALKAAVLALGGKWIGQGKHHLFAGDTIGLGFTLLNWRYPLVLAGDGKLNYDDYHGEWGNSADLERLKGEYAIALAEVKATELGWMTERVEGQLVIYHPESGQLVVTADGTIEACQFTGSGCHAAIESLGLQLTDIQLKPEYAAVAAEVQQGA